MPPEIIADRYELGRPIGIGGMAEVFLAIDRLLQREVAIKILNRAYASDPSFVERFKREAQAAASLDHPNVVPTYDWGATGDTYYIAMGFVAGENLKQVLLQHGPLSETEALRIAADVAAALEAAHQRGIVHRDIKPHNILLDPDGQVKVTDFGIAQAAGQAQLTETSVVLGTASYISPEQANQQPVDNRSDIYSLGIVAYELLAGRVPFLGDSIVSVALLHLQEPPPPIRLFRPEVSRAVEHAVLKALAKNPDDRYQSAGEMRQALEQVRAGLEGAATVPEARTGPVLLAAPLSSENTLDLAATRGFGRERLERDQDSRPNVWLVPVIALLLLVTLATVWVLSAASDTDDPTDNQVNAAGGQAAGLTGTPTPPPEPTPTMPPTIEPAVAATTTLESEPSPTSEPTPATPAPTLTPQPQPQPQPNSVPEPTPTVPALTPTPEPEPTPTPTPQPEPTPTPTPEPPPPTPTPVPPTPTPTPEPTPAPTSVPTPTPAPEPTAEAAGEIAAGPASTVTRFYQLVDQRQFDQAAQLWSERMRANFPPEENIDGRFAATQDIVVQRADVVSIDEAAGVATVEIDIVETTSSQPTTRRWVGNWHLVRDSGVWLLDQPNLRQA